MNSISCSIFGHNLIFINDNLTNYISPNSIGDIKFIRVDDFDIAQYGKVYNWIKLSNKDARVALSREPFAPLGDSRWALEVKDTLKLGWSGDMDILFSYSCSVDELLFWIFHTFLPISLDYSNKMSIFHASAIEVNNKSILFLAPSYGGKSTLADNFVKRGYKLLGDDSIGVCIEKESIYTVSSYPFRRPYRRVRELGIYTDSFLSGFVELDKIFLLKRANIDSDIKISSISNIEAFEALSKALFVTYSRLSKEKMSLIAKLVRENNIYRVSIPWSRDRVDEVIDTIIS